jgi:hypothetical protein
MKAARAEALADQFAEIATRLEQAEEKARAKAAELLPADMAKELRLVDVFVAAWVADAAKAAASEVRQLVERMRPARRRRVR